MLFCPPVKERRRICGSVNSCFLKRDKGGNKREAGCASQSPLH